MSSVIVAQGMPESNPEQRAVSPVAVRAASAPGSCLWLQPGCVAVFWLRWAVLGLGSARITRSGTRGGEELPVLSKKTNGRRRHQQQLDEQPTRSLLSTMRLTRSAVRPYVCPSCRAGAVAGRRRFASQPEQVPDVYDVVCVGGGPAGLGLLAALSMSMSISIGYS